MALGLYKPEQGYWMRVMAACLVGTFALATAGWLWGQGKLIADKLPRSSYIMSINITRGAPAAGAAIELLGAPPSADAPAPVIGTAEILEWRDRDRVLAIKPPAMNEGSEVQEATALRDAKDNAVFSAAVSSRATGIHSVEPLVIQGSLAGLILLGGAAMALYFAGMRHRTVDFLIATDGEMKRVNWSTPREIRGSTYVVIGACFLLAFALFTFDFVFQAFFKAIGVLAD